MPFVYKNIEFHKSEKENWVVARGEIFNNSGTNYNSVAFRIIIFIKGSPLITSVVTVNGFGAGKRQYFEKQIEGLDAKMIDHIIRFEIHAEGAY